MSDSTLRHDKICENCGYTVDLAYCSECGQKNVETRQSFMHLAGHFMEDFTHYDSGFWRTVKYLLFRPAKLTKDYLEGKKITYTPPVKLYIFISFIAFLIPAILPNLSSQQEDENKGMDDLRKPLIAKTEIIILDDGRVVNSMKELDLLWGLDNDKGITFQEYLVRKAEFNIKDYGMSCVDLGRTFVKVLPKVLFLYMPIFAFWLWLFHGKKRWYFFDHGIFTLHYYSFLLLLFTILYFISWFLIQVGASDYIPIPILIYIFYPFFYFFRAHRRMYGESRLISRLKSFILFWINMISIVFAILLTVGYIVITYHN